MEISLSIRDQEIVEELRKELLCDHLDSIVHHAIGLLYREVSKLKGKYQTDIHTLLGLQD